MSSQVIVRRHRARSYAKGEKAYWVKKPIVPIVIRIETDEEIIEVRTKIKMISTPPEAISIEHVIFEALAGVLEKMTRSTLWKDAIYEMREASLITHTITPTVESMEVIVMGKEKSQTPAPKSIDDQDHKHE